MTQSIIGPGPLYDYLRYCERSDLEKSVLDCGAGGRRPPLAVFYEYGYKTYGIELSNEQIEKSDNWCKNNNVELNIAKGDMRALPFADESVSFVYSYHTIFHMSKKDIRQSVGEMLRVLKKGGLCYVNFLSVEDGHYGVGEEISEGEFIECEGDETWQHTYFEDDEADNLFYNCKILRKEKRIQLITEHHKMAYIEYIVKKL